MEEETDVIRRREGMSKNQNDQGVSQSTFITNIPEINALVDKAKKFAMSQAPVLITGESGVGKEVIAKLIHNQSQRSDDAFVAINSCAFPQELFESELFGHEKGAFTGADSLKEGCFELADHGTLFMDEIGEMPLMMQAKVLRAVELNSFRRLGGKREITVDIRIIAATNKILMEKVEDRSFREDLYHRLNVLELYIPPLRHRVPDIPLLLDYFLDHFKKKYKQKDFYFSDETLDIFKEYKWPGNVRELRNIVERCLVLSPTEKIEPSILPSQYFNQSGSVKSKDPDRWYNIPIGRTLEEIEREVVAKTLLATDNNKTKAAKILGVTRKTLNSKL